MRWILNADGKPERCDDIIRWAQWFEDIDGRRVALHKHRLHTISTVFLGLEHGNVDGKPILWETLVEGPLLETMRRYTSRTDAVRGHHECVNEIEELAMAQAGWRERPDARQHTRCRKCGWYAWSRALRFCQQCESPLRGWLRRMLRR